MPPHATPLFAAADAAVYFTPLLLRAFSDYARRAAYADDAAMPGRLRARKMRAVVEDSGRVRAVASCAALMITQRRVTEMMAIDI